MSGCVPYCLVAPPAGADRCAFHAGDDRAEDDLAVVCMGCGVVFIASRWTTEAEPAVPYCPDCGCRAKAALLDAKTHCTAETVSGGRVYRCRRTVTANPHVAGVGRGFEWRS